MLRKGWIAEACASVVGIWSSRVPRDDNASACGVMSRVCEQQRRRAAGGGSATWLYHGWRSGRDPQSSKLSVCRTEARTRFRDRWQRQRPGPSCRYAAIPVPTRVINAIPAHHYTRFYAVWPRKPTGEAAFYPALAYSVCSSARRGNSTLRLGVAVHFVVGLLPELLSWWPWFPAGWGAFAGVVVWHLHSNAAAPKLSGSTDDGGGRP